MYNFFNALHLIRNDEKDLEENHRQKLLLIQRHIDVKT